MGANPYVGVLTYAGDILPLGVNPYVGVFTYASDSFFFISFNNPYVGADIYMGFSPMLVEH